MSNMRHINAVQRTGDKPNAMKRFQFLLVLALGSLVGCTILNPRNVADIGYGIKMMDCTNRHCKVEFRYPKDGSVVLAYPHATNVPLDLTGNISVADADRVMFSVAIPCKTNAISRSGSIKADKKIDGYMMAFTFRGVLRPGKRYEWLELNSTGDSKGCVLRPGKRYEWRINFNQEPPVGLALYYFWIPWYCYMP